LQFQAGMAETVGPSLLKKLEVPMHRMRVALVALLLPLSLTGCLETIGAFGTGAMVTVEYVLTGEEPRTLSHEYERTKRAVLIALCRMNIAVDQAQEAEDGEEILGRAGKLEVRVELKRITLTATRISVRVQEDFFSRDKATAREIIRQIAAISEDMESTASRKLSRRE
jgi:Protein of unknown function (DUF3568)